MNRIVHFEIHAPDPQKAIDFYTTNFGWKIQKWEGGAFEYWTVETGDKNTPGINGGLMPSRDGQPRTVNTLEVDDVDAAAKKVEKTGGTIVVPKMAIPGVGWIAYATDPGGNILGLYKHDPSAK